MAQSETGAAILAPLYLDYLANGRDWEAGPNEVPGALLSGVFACRGIDEWVALELEDIHDWTVICDYLERRDLDLEGGDVTPERRDLLRAAIAEWTREITPLQAAHRLQRVGLAVGPVQNSEDIWRDVQFRSRGAFVEVRHPDVGVVEYPAAPNRLSETPGHVRRPGPRLGEHTREVLAEWVELPEVCSQDPAGQRCRLAGGPARPNLRSGSRGGLMHVATQ